MKSPRDKVNFKLKMSEIGKYSTADIDLSQVPPEELEKFSQKVIQRAKELKAKQIALYNADTENKTPPTYSDEFYLKMARNIEYEELIGGFKEINKRRIRNYEIKDAQWAQYSYEQIIQMENNGYKIPQEVLEWAHAQQQADVTDYIVVSDSAQTDDSSSTQVTKSSDEVSILRAKAVQDIAQVEKAEKETQKAVEQYSDVEKRAKQIQHEKQDKFKDSMTEINNLTKEWKTLKDKQDKGVELTNEEKNRFKQLGGVLNGSNGTLIKEIKVDNEELEDFLTNLDGLNKKIDTNIELAQETIQDATDLGNMEKNYLVSKFPWVHSGIVFDGHGLSLSTLYNIRAEEISSIAMKKGKDLNQYSESISTDLSNDENVKLTDFAIEYNEMSEKTQQNTKKTMGEDYDKSSDEKTDKKGSQQDKYSVVKVFSYINSVAATTTTINATADMLSSQGKTEKENKELIVNLKKTQNDTKKLEKETKTAAEKHETNEITAEQFLAKLEETQPVETQPQMVEETNSAKFESKETKSVEIQPTENQNEMSPEKVQVIEKLVKISQEDKKVFNDVQKNINNSSNSTNESNAKIKQLQTENTNLKSSKKTAEKVATDTMFVGMGTTVQSFMTRAIGADLIATGLVMTNSIIPATVLAGMKMVASGVVLTNIGELEFVTGTMATVTGAATLATSATVDGVQKANELAGKTAQQIVKSGKEIITQSAKSLGITSDIQTSDTENAAVSSDTQNNSQSEENVQMQAVNIQDEQTNQKQEIQQQSPQVSLNENNNIVKPLNSDTKGLTDLIKKDEKTTKEKQQDKWEETKTVSKAGMINESSTQKKTEYKTEKENNIIEEKSQSSVKEEELPKPEETDSAGKDENSQNAEKNSKKQQDKYTVKDEFSLENAIQATTTTTKATSDMLFSKDEAGKKETSLKFRMKKMDEANKNIEKNKDTAKSVQDILITRINAKKGQLENATSELQIAEKNGDEAIMVSAQANVQQLSNDMINTIATSMSANNEFETKALDANNQLQGIQSEQMNLRSELQKFTKQSDNQLDVSKDTVKVGAGTILLGTGDQIGGLTMFLAGKALVSSAGLNLGQIYVGLAMMSSGGAIMDYGLLEKASGVVATATGVAGVTTNVAAQVQKALIGETQKTGISFLNLTRGKVRENAQMAVKMKEERNSIIEDTNNISAAASSNVNNIKSVETSDKTDRKLTNFNEEVNKEFKKRRRRVMGVSATSTGL